MIQILLIGDTNTMGQLTDAVDVGRQNELKFRVTYHVLHSPFGPGPVGVTAVGLNPDESKKSHT